MVPIPWSYVNSWRCICCGICCKEFDVVLRFDEWLRLVRKYGIGVTKAGLNRFYIEKKSDGSCLFLYGSVGKWFCGLQHTKPMACKLWPFKILHRPKYGASKDAAFDYKGGKFYVYIDPLCPEIRWGRPSEHLIYQVIPEFVEIALGNCEKQVYSTFNVQYDTFSPIRRGRLIF